MLRRSISVTLFAAILAVLVACNSAEERADKHYQSAVELIEAGDTERGLVELRNALKLKNDHAAARLLYARTVRAQGKFSDAYGQYLRHTEYYPEDFEARLALAEMSLEQRNWPEVERHLKVAQVLDPNHLKVRIVGNALDYFKAVEAKDAAAQEKAAETARSLIREAPDAQTPREVLIDYLLRQRDLEAALEEIDAALALTPDALGLHRLRLAVLNDLGDTEGVEAELRAMLEQFPDNTEVRAALLRWYMTRGEHDKAEAFLRERAATAEGEAREHANADLVRFLIEVRGPEVGRAELDRLIAEAGPDSESGHLYRALRAGLDFDTGQREQAIAEMQALLEKSEPSDRTRNFKVMLARFYRATGNAVGARELIEQVLAEDASHVEAMKIKARWLIEADQTDEAIILLRAALEQSPQDAEIMRILASAYERAGDRELMGEMLSLAVEASGKAPGYSLDYARFLQAEGKDIPAERVLIDALRLAPTNLDLLSELAQVYIRLEDWPRATQIADTLSRLEGPRAKALEKELRLAILQAQDRDEEVMRFLEGLTNDETVDPRRLRVAMVRTHLLAGRTQAALDEIEKALQEFPGDPGLRALRARLLEREGRREEAIAIYRELLQQTPKAEALWRELYAALLRAGREEEARAALEQGLEAVGEAPTLLWIKASLAERGGDIDTAIEIYERLYERNSSNLIIANNLASLLASYRADDPQALERAHAIARRLRNSSQPYFRDTYGWIAHLRGDQEEALKHLEPAARQDTGEAVINYHLAMVYLAMGRMQEAEAELRRALEIAGPADTRPEIEAARAELARLVEQGKRKAKAGADETTGNADGTDGQDPVEKD